jgi:ABC-type dipeptide/oligopeptide/nickel transport system ATPase component
MPLLSVQNLHLGFRDWHGEVKSAVRDISFSIEPGEGCALVGESGSGKSVIALTLTRLIPEPPAVIQSGQSSSRGKIS